MRYGNSYSVRSIASSRVEPGHKDFSTLAPIAADVRRRVSNLESELPLQIYMAMEYVLDPIRTGRTRLAELDNVEKTFVGLKVEHFVRDMLDAPKGIRDLVLAGQNVDIKNTVNPGWSWMIPPETYNSSEPCLLIAIDELRWEVWTGLIAARQEYLGKPNRDGKRGIPTWAYENILWLVKAAPLPKNSWEGIDMARFRELRQMSGGTRRAAMYFRENIGRPTHRSVLQALLYDQLDYMKRLRDNGGAKDRLKIEGIALLSGTYFNKLLYKMGMSTIDKDEHIAIRPINSEQERLLRDYGEL